MQKTTLYTLSLLFTIGAGLSILFIQMDELYSAMFISILLIILSCITRAISKDQKKKAWDLIVLFAIIIPVFFVKLFPPMTIFFVTYGQGFNKTVASMLIVIPIILLLIHSTNNVLIDKIKERKNNLKLFISTLILTILVFFGLNLYGNTLDLNKELNTSERIYLYSYRKYTSQIIETAFKDIESGTDQVSQKMAIGYLSDYPNMNEVYKKRLSGIIFSKVIYGAAFEGQIESMIKLDPIRTIKVLEEVNKDGSFNLKVSTLNYLYRIVNNNPELKNDACYVGNEVYENAKKQVSNNQWDLESLELPSKAGRFKDMCGIK